ncbi:MAG: glycosyltransferase family 4 protein [Chloroflexota bacterium]
MKIAQIAPPWLPIPPVGYGGIELVMYDLTEGLVRNGHEVLLFGTGDSSTSARLIPLVDRHIGQDWLPTVAPGIVHATSRYAYVRAFLEQVDIIHDHTDFQELELPVPKSVYTIHGPAVSSAVARAKAIMAGGRGGLVAISHRQRELFEAQGVQFAGTVHNGIDAAAMPFGAAELKEPYLLFIGRANWEKGLDLAVRVAGRAGMPLVMAVKMTERHEQEYFHEHVDPWLAKGANVTLLGEITPQEKFDLYCRAQGTLFSSQWEEPFGLVMTESMACGTPVIALRRGAAPEVIRDGITGFLCDDEDGLVAAVPKLQSIDPHACRKHMLEHFSVEEMARQYAAVYERVLRNQ